MTASDAAVLLVPAGHGFSFASDTGIVHARPLVLDLVRSIDLVIDGSSS